MTAFCISSHKRANVYGAPLRAGMGGRAAGPAVGLAIGLVIGFVAAVANRVASFAFGS